VSHQCQQHHLNINIVNQQLQAPKIVLVLIQQSIVTMPPSKTIKQYTCLFIAFMKFIRDADYELNHIFTDEVLATIRPDDIIWYFKHETF
jgi:hypothetical protein